MKKWIKIFTSSRLDKIEEDVNAWLRSFHDADVEALELHSFDLKVIPGEVTDFYIAVAVYS